MSLRANVKLDRSKKLAQKFKRAEIQGIIKEGMEHAAELGKLKAHVQTGELEASIHAEFTSAYRGALVSDVPQAVFEMEKGGEHDWATNAFNAGVELIHERIHELLSE